MKERFLCFAVLFLTGLIHAQSADFVTELLQSERATYGQVCYLTAVYREIIDENSSVEDAVNALKSRGDVSKAADAEDPADFGEAARLFAKIWNVKGHLLFTISKGSRRYAFKKFKKDGVVPTHADPHAVPSGVDILNIFTAGNEIYAADKNQNGVLKAAEK
ncbi:MAG: hypothetical protein ACTTKL_09545 [Treponema sp.]